MKPRSWTCPYCGHAQTVTATTYDQSDIIIDNTLSKHGRIAGRIRSIVCSNADCKEITLSFSLHSWRPSEYGMTLSNAALHAWPLLPESSAKPQPDYIPEPIVENYKQACRIRDLSPNASATMSRRCLQGMIRDFCQITKPTLAQEINALRALVDTGKGPKGVSSDTLEAIDHIRSIGNIGAHMEKDINLLIDVEPNEAQVLIDLIELLLEEWYVAKQLREAKLEKIGIVAHKKKAIKEQSTPSSSIEKPVAPELNRD